MSVYRCPRSVLAVAALACAGLAAAEKASEAPVDRRRAPFVMPPSGKGDELVGALGYEAPSALTFDRRNRPYMFDTRDAAANGTLWTLRDGKWVRRSFAEAIRKACPKFASFVATPQRPDVHSLSSMTIDDADGLYAIVRIRESDGKTRPVLVYSPDLGQSFQAYVLAGEPNQAFLEVRVGHNDLSRPPAIGLLKLRKPHPARWTAYYLLSVVVPVKKDGRLEWPPAVAVTENCFGTSNHSGGYSFAVTTGKRTHLVYGEIPADGKTGNPTFAATYDREQRKIIARQFLATAPPKVPDVHSTPVIAADSKGRLHAVAGAHGQSFLYLRSNEPDRIDAGWTQAKPVGVRQTYAALICDPQDRLHLAFREWKGGVATLSSQSKPAAADAWPPSRTLVFAPAKQRGYGIFYHRFFIDRRGALYLSFTFNAQKGGTYPRALMLSEDAGRTWQLATTQAFLRRTVPGKR